MNRQIILIAGPYRSGTQGNADLIAQNLARLEEARWRSGNVDIFR
jgi:hypothetical protein